MSDDKISVDALRKLPPGQFLSVEEIVDMDRKKVRAIKWMWREPPHPGVRVGFFSLETGDYLYDDLTTDLG